MAETTAIITINLFQERKWQTLTIGTTTFNNDSPVESIEIKNQQLFTRMDPSLSTVVRFNYNEQKNWPHFPDRIQKMEF